MKCLEEGQLAELLDGGVAPNRAESLHAHIAECPACTAAMAELSLLASDLAALPACDEAAHVARVMARLDEPRPRREPVEGKRRWAVRALAGASVVAVAASVALVLSRGRVDDGAFASRGASASPALERNVGVSVFTGGTSLVRLTGGARIGGEEALTAAYTNVHPKPVYLLLFAVDAHDAVHWLHPAYVDVKEDPASVPLPRADHEVPLPTSVVLDAPAKGALRLISVVTETPLRVSDVERREARGLSKESLARAFFGSAVSELRITVGTEP
jgi:hypothetical protein